MLRRALDIFGLKKERAQRVSAVSHLRCEPRQGVVVLQGQNSSREPMGSSPFTLRYKKKDRHLPVLFFGELDGNRAEPLEKPEWFRRFICFSIEKKSTEYLITPFAGIEINKKPVIRC